MNVLVEMVSKYEKYLHQKVFHVYEFQILLEFGVPLLSLRTTPLPCHKDT